MLKVKKLDKRAKLPTRAYDGDLGFDLYLLEDTLIPAYEGDRPALKKLRTGIAVKFPKGWGGFIKDRSSIATKDRLITVAGVIDNGYTGEIIVAVVNLSGKDVYLSAGTKIAQLVPIPVFDGSVVEVDELEETKRGDKGFGSSGRC